MLEMACIISCMEILQTTVAKGGDAARYELVNHVPKGARPDRDLQMHNSKGWQCSYVELHFNM